MFIYVSLFIQILSHLMLHIIKMYPRPNKKHARGAVMAEWSGALRHVMGGPRFESRARNSFRAN